MVTTSMKNMVIRSTTTSTRMKKDIMVKRSSLEMKAMSPTMITIITNPVLVANTMEVTGVAKPQRRRQVKGRK